MKLEDRRFTEKELGYILKLEMLHKDLLRDMAKLHGWKYDEYVRFLTDVFLSRTFFDAYNTDRLYASWTEILLDKSLIKTAVQEVLDMYKHERRIKTLKKEMTIYARPNRTDLSTKLKRHSEKSKPI